MATYKKGAFAFGMSLDEAGERLGVIYADTSNGVISMQTVFYDLKEHEKISEYSFDGEFPLGCSFLDGGGFAVVSDSAIRIFDKRLNKKNVSDSYAAQRVSAVYVDKDYCAVTFNNGIITDENDIFVFDKKGSLVYNDKIASDVSQLALRDGSVFIKNSEGVLRIVKNGAIGAARIATVSRQEYKVWYAASLSSLNDPPQKRFLLRRTYQLLKWSHTKSWIFLPAPVTS